MLETRHVSFHAERGNRFDPVSSKTIRFCLADHGFLEASSVKLALTIQNTGDQTITPCGQTMSLFRRARLSASSQLVEDRVELATEIPITERLKDGARRRQRQYRTTPIASFNNDQYATLAAGKSRRLIASTPLGVLNQENGYHCILFLEVSY